CATAALGCRRPKCNYRAAGFSRQAEMGGEVGVTGGRSSLRIEPVENRRSPLPWATATIEEVSQANGEAREDIPAVERLSRADEDRSLGSRVNPCSTLPGIDQPDQLHTGIEVFPDLAVHLPLGVAFAEDFDGEVRCKIRDRNSGALAVWEPVPSDEGHV